MSRAKPTKTKKTVPRMPRRASLFWDVDPKTLDQKKHARYIIERILDFGTDREVRWLMRTYSKRKIKAVIQQPRSVLHKKSQALWSLILK